MSPAKKKSQLNVTDSMVLAGIPIAIIYWVLDSILNIFFSNRYNIIAEIFGPGLYEIYTRVIVLCILVIFGAHAQTTINRLKNAADALQKSEDDHRAFIENLTAGVFRFSIDPAGQIVRANRAIAGIFGYRSIEDFLGAKISFLFSNPAEKEEFLRDITQNGSVGGRELAMRKRSGEVFWVSCSAAVVADDSGQATWIDGVIEDITVRKQAEEALRASEERYRQLIDCAPAGICEIDLGTYRFLRVNDLMSKLTGYSRAELLAGKIDAILTDDSKGVFHERLADLSNGKSGSDAAELKIRDKQGQESWVVVNDGIRSEPGRAETATVVMHDVSERKRTEHEKQLLEYQLFRAQKMEAVGTLAGGIAHDFNNLLMGIQGHISIMLSMTEYVHPYFNHFISIETYINNATDLTGKLLGFAKGGKYGREKVALNELVGDQIRVFEKTRKDDIRIKEKYEKALWVVEAEPLQIKQVIMNLVVNAFQAMPGGGDLSIVTQNVVLDENSYRHHDAKPGPYVKLTIGDTGIGMDEATMQRVFEPFFTTKKLGPQKGTGLGLASAYGIIKNHDGFITVHSKVGKGSSFSMFLPRSAENASAEKIDSFLASTEKETVLIVDKDDDVRGVLEQMLKKLGFRVLQAKDGWQALESVRQAGDRLDAVILDGDLPETDGHELLRELKKINPVLKTVISSRRDRGEMRDTIEKLDAGGFLKKPFNLMQLTTQLGEISGS
ncbi:MAG: PAS domain S-box protein [Desulfobacterales bacterium]